MWCENPGEPAEPQGQLAGVKSEWSSRAGQYNADIIESAGGLAQSFSRVSCYISKINQIRLLIFGCETGLWISGNVIPLKIFIFCNIFWFTSAKTRKKAQAKQNSYRKREKKGNQSRESCDKHTLLKSEWSDFSKMEHTPPPHIGWTSNQRQESSVVKQGLVFE